MTWEKVNPDKWAGDLRGRTPHKKLIRRLRAIDVDILGALFAESGGVRGTFKIGNWEDSSEWMEFDISGDVFNTIEFWHGSGATYPRDNAGQIYSLGIGLGDSTAGTLGLWPPADLDHKYAALAIHSASSTTQSMPALVISDSGQTSDTHFETVALVASNETDTIGLQIQVQNTNTVAALEIETTSGGVPDPGITVGGYQIYPPLYLAMYGPGSNLTVTNSLQTIVFDTNLVDDSYITDSSGVFTLPDPGVYEIHVNVTVESIDTTAGIRGAPTIRVQVDTGGGYAQYGTDQADYVREDAGPLSAHMSWSAPLVTTGSNTLLRVRIYDQIATEPNEQVPADGAQIMIKRVR